MTSKPYTKTAVDDAVAAIPKPRQKRDYGLFSTTDENAMAHDLSNLLSAIDGFAQLLATDAQAIADEVASIRIGSIREATRQALQMLQDAQSTGDQPASPKQPIDLRSVMRMVFDQISATKPQQVAVRLNLPDVPINLSIDEVKLARALLNTVKNAVQAIDGKGRVTLSLVNESSSIKWEGLHRRIGVNLDVIDWRIEVEDTGIGMPDRILQQAFEPRFTTKPNAKSSGFGLQSILDFCDDRIGTVELATRRGSGTRMTFRFFKSDSETHERADATARLASVATQDSKKILVVDDNELAGLMLVQMLRRQRYAATYLTSAEEALGSDLSGFDLIISDMRMPDTDGIAFGDQVKAIHPRLPIILYSGARQCHASPDVFEAVLKKPIDPVGLGSIIQRVLSRSSRSHNHREKEW
jgi:CheY-like chemotaxis protein/anti-sigma regulatory factor (Ser/Thr protein kinase)